MPVIRKLILVASALLMSAPASAADYALLDPRFGTAVAEAPIKAQIIAAARAALDRPPGAIPRLHTEGPYRATASATSAYRRSAITRSRWTSLWPGA